MESRTGNGHRADFEKVCNDVRTVVHDSEILLKQRIHHVKERARQAFHDTGEVVQQRPLQMIAVVFGVGLVAGLLLFNMARPKKER